MIRILKFFNSIHVHGYDKYIKYITFSFRKNEMNLILWKKLKPNYITLLKIVYKLQYLKKLILQNIMLKRNLKNFIYKSISNFFSKILKLIIFLNFIFCISNKKCKNNNKHKPYLKLMYINYLLLLTIYFKD